MGILCACVSLFFAFFLLRTSDLVKDTALRCRCRPPWLFEITKHEDVKTFCDSFTLYDKPILYINSGAIEQSRSPISTLCTFFTFLFIYYFNHAWVFYFFLISWHDTTRQYVFAMRGSLDTQDVKTTTWTMIQYRGLSLPYCSQIFIHCFLQCVLFSTSTTSTFFFFVLDTPRRFERRTFGRAIHLVVNPNTNQNSTLLDLGHWRRIVDVFHLFLFEGSFFTLAWTFLVSLCW